MALGWDLMCLSYCSIISIDSSVLGAEMCERRESILLLHESGKAFCPILKDMAFQVGSDGIVIGRE